MSEPTHGELATALRDLTAEVRAHAHSNGNGKSKILTVDMLIKVLLVALAAILSYQRMQDRQEFLDTRVRNIELWQDTERQLVISLDRRLVILERPASDPSITIKRR